MRRLQIAPVEPMGATVRRVTALAAPVALGELGWMAMSVVDTVMVGGLGPSAIGAIGIGSSAFYTFAIFGMGILLSLDTVVSQAWGAGNREDCRHSLMQGLYLALLLSAPLMLLFAFMPRAFATLGIIPDVAVLSGQFIRVLNYGTLPLLVYGALRRYLQAIGRVRPVMFALISANLVNWYFNWLLIAGHGGFPAWGVRGSAASTCIARVYMAAVLAIALWSEERRQPPGFNGIFQPPDWARIRNLIRIGLPAATQILLEIGAFGAVAVLAGRLSAGALAAHQIALNCAAVTYMVPLGVSAAAAITVGHAIGSGDARLARRSGFVAAVLACLFMGCAALVFVFAPRPILAIYTNDETVIRIGIRLLALAACFQLFDGIQTVMTGALRGAGETRMPMIVNLCGYYLMGLPAGWLLCFRYGKGIYGLWVGLTVALVVIALILLFEWRRVSHRLLANDGSA